MTGGPPVALHLLPFARKLIRHLAWCGIPDSRHSGEPRERLDLSYANLSYANLSYADLSYADLSGAGLSGTCLDPAAPVPPCSSADLASAGLTVRVIDGEEWILGVRSRRSLHVGSTDYSEPGEYVAPYLSVDASTECHPGIYLGGSERIPDPVPARCRRNEAVFVSASKGARTRRLVREREVT